MIDLLTVGFLQRALLAGIMVSVLCGVLSVFVILRRMAFIGVGISHSAFGGVALGFLLGVPPLWTGVTFSVLVAIIIEWARKHSRIGEDAAIGILFSASMAVGVVLLHLSRTYNVDVFGFLFGNILAVARGELAEIFVLTVAALSVFFAFYKELVFLSFDEEMAWVSGVPVGMLRYVFMVVMAVVVIMSMYLVGIILVEALLVIPGATARNLTRHIRAMVMVSIAVSTGSTVGGLWLSYQLDLPSGAAVVLLLAVLFFFSILPHRLGRPLRAST
jgi:ABC-type Mn2+/Zn2+ transport system permease subunit